MELLTRRDGDVLHLTLNRPQARNGLNRELRLALADAIGGAGDARVIVLRGAEGNFCAGQDLVEAGQLLKLGQLDAKRILAEEYEPVLEAIEASEAPIIAAVEGAAAGAGLSLALACDIVIAKHSARFHIAFGKMALVHDVGASYILPRLIGQARAMGFALTGEPISAEQAAHWGMIWQAVPDDAFEAKLDALCQNLSSNARLTNKGMRQLTRQSLSQNREDMLALEADLQARAMSSDDFKEAATAFFEKRKPRFA